MRFSEEDPRGRLPAPANLLGGRCCAAAGKLSFSSNAWSLGSPFKLRKSVISHRICSCSFPLQVSDYLWTAQRGRSGTAVSKSFHLRWTIEKTAPWGLCRNKQRWPAGQRSSGSGGWYSCWDWQATLAGPSRIYFGNAIAETCQDRARWLARAVRRIGQEAILSPTASTAMGG